MASINMSDAVVFIADFPLYSWTSGCRNCQRGVLACKLVAFLEVLKMFRALLIPALLTAVLTISLNSNAQTKRAMTIDDLITAVRVSDPQVSPDGKRVLYTRTTTELQTGKRNSDIWVVPADGSAPA